MWLANQVSSCKRAQQHFLRIVRKCCRLVARAPGNLPTKQYSTAHKPEFTINLQRQQEISHFFLEDDVIIQDDDITNTQPTIIGRFDRRELHSYNGHRDMPTLHACDYNESKACVQRKKRKRYWRSWCALTNSHRLLAPCHTPLHICLKHLHSWKTMSDVIMKQAKSSFNFKTANNNKTDLIRTTSCCLAENKAPSPRAGWSHRPCAFF